MRTWTFVSRKPSWRIYFQHKISKDFTTQYGALFFPQVIYKIYNSVGPKSRRYCNTGPTRDRGGASP